MAPDGYVSTRHMDVMLDHRQGGMSEVLFQQEHISSIQQEPCGVRMPEEMCVEAFHPGGCGQSVHQGFYGFYGERVAIYGHEE